LEPAPAERRRCDLRLSFFGGCAGEDGVGEARGADMRLNIFRPYGRNIIGSYIRHDGFSAARTGAASFKYQSGFLLLIEL